MIGRRNKPVGVVLAGPERIDAGALREAVDSPAVLRAAAAALAGLQRAVAQLDRRALLALTGGDLAALGRLAALPDEVAGFQRRVADELARDGAVRFAFDAGCRDLIEAASAAERALSAEATRDKAKMDDRLVKLRSAGVTEEDIARLTDAAAPDRAADRARVAALKAEAEQARVFLANPLRPVELLPVGIRSKG